MPRVEKVDWLKIAKVWYEGQGATLYAGEIIDHLKAAGMIKSQHPEIIKWAKARDKEDRRP